MAYLRAMAINAMINECSTTFLENERKLLAGSFDTSLADSIPSRKELQSLQDLARARCSRALEYFVPAAAPPPESPTKVGFSCFEVWELPDLGHFLQEIERFSPGSCVGRERRPRRFGLR
jgi:hypothetical protein